MLRPLRIVCAVLALLPAAATAAPPAGRSDALAKMIAQTLKDRPDILADAIKRFQRPRPEVGASVIRDQADALLRDPTSPVTGNPDGSVTVVVFSDYSCGHCRRADPIVDKVVKADGAVRVVTKELPILGPVSVVAAKAALAMHADGRYAAYRTALMSSPEPLTEARILSTAESLGADVAQLRDTIVNDRTIPSALDRNAKLATDLGITGTPAFVVGDRIIRGAPTAAVLQAAIADARTQNRIATP